MEQGAREIEIKRISPNLRIIFAAECIEEMARSMESLGQQEPIRICFEHDSFRILDGEKRWRACKRLRLKTISAVIVE